jgi:hypothetical protein
MPQGRRVKAAGRPYRVVPISRIQGTAGKAVNAPRGKSELLGPHKQHRQNARVLPMRGATVAEDRSSIRELHGACVLLATSSSKGSCRSCPPFWQADSAPVNITLDIPVITLDIPVVGSYCNRLVVTG